MAARTLRYLNRGGGPIVVVVLLVLASLTLVSKATHGSTRFSELYSLLLVVNLLALLTLAGLILWNLVRLLRQVRRRRAGALLTVRMVTIFVLLSVTPVLVIYYFSLEFLHRGIDSWFDVRVERALNDSLELSRAALGLRMRELLKQTEVIGSDLSIAAHDKLANMVEDARRRSGATELTLVGPKGNILATANVDPATIVPDRPNDAILLQLRRSGSYIGLDPVGDAGLYVRVVVKVAADIPSRGSRALQALYPVTKRINELADNVQAAFAKYRELAYLREPLKTSFTLTLSLVLLLSLLTSVWAAFFSARRLVAPLRNLAKGTRAVAAGDFDTRLRGSGSDDVGFLVDSFNRMTGELGRAREEMHRSQAQLESQRAYLDTVLSRLSSGVLTLDPAARLVTANDAAETILGVPLATAQGMTLAALCDAHPHLAPINAQVMSNFGRGSDATEPDQRDWRAQTVISGPRGRQVLMCSGTLLPDTQHGRAGQVVVFDDVTTLIDAQRNAAWSEVARRLAHEIKNPLTPIQLSAERLRYKYMRRLDAGDEQTFDRLTRTIVQQVEAMKSMVNAFSDYARSPHMRHEPVDLNALIVDIVELYRASHTEARISATLDPELKRLSAADPDRLRQLLHNLVKNALEAQDLKVPEVRIITRALTDTGRRFIELSVSDCGPGFDREMIERVFEPYVTSKRKGTGLGLAIVRKIAEEHSGAVGARNLPEGGACITVRLPCDVAGARDEGDVIAAGDDTREVAG